MKRLHRYLVTVLVLLLVPCAAAIAEGSDADTIHALIKSWNAASQAKDAEAFASIYAPNAVVMMEGMPDMHGAEAIREGIAGMMQDPNFSLSFEATEVVVAGSGDLAYELGTYDIAMSDPEGNPAAQSGHYVVVWQKQADGAWKVVVDAPVSDPPAAED